MVFSVKLIYGSKGWGGVYGWAKTMKQILYILYKIQSYKLWTPIKKDVDIHKTQYTLHTRKYRKKLSSSNKNHVVYTFSHRQSILQIKLFMNKPWTEYSTNKALFEFIAINKVLLRLSCLLIKPWIKYFTDKVVYKLNHRSEKVRFR